MKLCDQNYSRSSSRIKQCWISELAAFGTETDCSATKIHLTSGFSVFLFLKMLTHLSLKMFSQKMQWQGSITANHTEYLGI